MPIVLLLTAFLSNIVFYSEEILAAATSTPQTMEKVEAREQSFMDFLNQVFQVDSEVVKEHDQALQSTVSDMESCPYTNSIADSIKDAFRADCEELINKARGEQDISYFLLRKSVEEGSFTADRKQTLMNLIQNTKDIVLNCECNGDTVFTLRHKYDTPEEEQERIGIEECSKRGHTNDSLKVTCHQNEETIEQEKKEAVAYIQSQLESCAYKTTEIEESDSFSCKALMEEAKNTGLSYHQIRYAIQKDVEKLEFLISSVEEETDKAVDKQAEQQKIKP